eukprot:6224944-Amphidinium_carterae.1
MVSRSSASRVVLKVPSPLEPPHGSGCWERRKRPRDGSERIQLHAVRLARVRRIICMKQYVVSFRR